MSARWSTAPAEAPAPRFYFSRSSYRSASLAALALVLTVLPTRAYADFIRPDTAVASSEFTAGFNGEAVNTINGSGLPAGFDLTDTHAAYASGNHWTTAAGTAPATQSITWGFTAPQTLDTFYVWNHLSTAPPATNTGYDVTLFDLTLLDASDNVLLTLNDVALAPDTNAAQAFSFGGPIAGVSSVRFDIEAVQSSPTFTGLAEVGFNTAAVATAVPEAGTLALLPLGALALAGVVLGRQRSLNLSSRRA